MTDQAEMPKTLKLINTEQLRADAEILLKNYSTIRVRFVAESVLALLAEVEKAEALHRAFDKQTTFLKDRRFRSGCACDINDETGEIDQWCDQHEEVREERDEARAEVEGLREKLQEK